MAKFGRWFRVNLRKLGWEIRVFVLVVVAAGVFIYTAVSVQHALMAALTKNAAANGTIVTQFFWMVGSFFTMAGGIAQNYKAQIVQLVQSVHDRVASTEEAVHQAEKSSMEHRLREEELQARLIELMGLHGREVDGGSGFLELESLDDLYRDEAAHVEIMRAAKDMLDRHAAAGYSDSIAKFKYEAAELRRDQVRRRIEQKMGRD